jgi:hypothetical protein
MKSSVFWDITPYNPLKLNRRFRGTSLWFLPASCWSLASLILHPWRWRRHVPPKLRWLLTDYAAIYPRRWNSS